MQYTGEDELTMAGFALVRKYDPKLYERMQRELWLVSESDLARDGIGADVGEQRSAFALTAGRKANHMPYSLTWVNAALISETARSYNMPAEVWAAATLAHEYEHTQQSERDALNTLRAESEAFQFGARFSKRLPAPYGEFLARYQIATMDAMARGEMPMYNAQHAANNS